VGGMSGVTIPRGQECLYRDFGRVVLFSRERSPDEPVLDLPTQKNENLDYLHLNANS
jgi:hypothetical protein